MSEPRQAVFFVNVWPEPRSSAAGLRTRELSEFVQRLGYTLTAIGPDASSEHSEAWNNQGIPTITCDPNSTGAAEALKTLSPSLVIYDRFYTEEKFGWRARELWPDSLQMIDTIDIHSLRGARQNAARAKAEVFEPLSDYFGDEYLREMSSLHRADVCLVVSAYEAKWLAEQGIETDRICYLPFSATPETRLKPQSERSGFCFIGNYMHAPNLDAVRWLESELWPALRAKLPGAELHLYGAYPPQSVSQLKGQNGITSHGFVEDHRQAIAHHEVLVAPLRFGAGIKGKVLEAWASGTPVIGTPLAFESMGEGFAEFQTMPEFIEQILSLQKPDVWQRNVSLGLQRLRDEYDQDKIFATFSKFLEASRTNLPRHRQALTGRLLRYDDSRSQRYFSKWIEEKNKNR